MNQAFMDRLWEEIKKVKRFDRRTVAANRTRSKRALSGSRRNKRQRIARVTRDSDCLSWSDIRNIYTIGPANHAARFHDIRDMFPLAPGQAVPAKRWP